MEAQKSTRAASDNTYYVVLGFAFLIGNKMETNDPVVEMVRQWIVFIVEYSPAVRVVRFFCLYLDRVWNVLRLHPTVPTPYLVLPLEPRRSAPFLTLLSLAGYALVTALTVTCFRCEST